ncbi:MOSC domain-containing protein [Candidatus Woesearchaeota archaeon]|nr:MOSC domain-containing protein [Candidatus Woesearchaeota archaeon]
MEYQNGKIWSIMVYPVKGAAGIEVLDATLTKSGLRHGFYADHEFMIVRAEPDENGLYNFITQRDRRDKQDRLQGLADMSLIKPEFVGDILRLTWKYFDPIDVAYDRNHGKELSVKIWDDECYAVDQGDEVAEWLSGYLDLPVRMVKASGSFSRLSRQDYMRNDNPLRFQDSYPVHWFSIESVDELSQIAGERIPWQSFRPQIVVDGLPAQYEHKIHSGNIAGIPFVDPKPCDRCPVTNVDQHTGDIKVGRALTHLAKYKRWVDRNRKKKVIFGENMLPHGNGEILLGDDLVATSHRDPPLVYG